jgi:outer membrane protein OmpA-like peptidoglycan-associated protein
LTDIIEFFAIGNEGEPVMKQCLKVMSIIVITAFVYAAQGNADTVLLNNGDRLIGIVQTSYFALQSPYGQIVIKNDFLKRISLSDGRPGDAKLQTINNDLFSGRILNEDIQIQLQTETSATLDIKDLKLIMLDTVGPSHPIVTTIFTTQNNDRFSGKLVNPGLRLEADFKTLTYQPEDINRIEFTGDERKDVRALMANGDIIEGVLKLDEMIIAPDSLSRLTMSKSGLSSVQFNARKMVLKEYDSLPASEKDGDGDGVPDNSDKCPDTPWGSKVDAMGCPKEPVVTRLVSKNSDSLDADNDGVLDPLDKCPQTPQTAAVDEKGCWATPSILFDFDSTRIKPEYYPALEVIVAVLKKNPGLKIEIQGNTDNTGPASYNQMLSEKRALAAKEYMVNKGIESERLKAVGFGATRNVASNENDAGRALNRRIEFVPIN